MLVTLVIIIAALLVGLSKGGLGPAAGALLTPLMSLIMPVSDAIGLTLPLLLVGDIFAMRAYWRQWDNTQLRLMLPAAAVGVLMGIALLTTLPDDLLRRLLGVITLGVVTYKLASDTLENVEYNPRNWHAWLAGWGSGFGSALANAGAPPYTAYMLLIRSAPRVFIATSVLFFFLLNMLKLPLFITADVIRVDDVIGIMWALPLVGIGVWVGSRLIDRVNVSLFDRLMLTLLALAGIALLVG
ncbi:MAG: sulfite exporter TauE/SafE family protein [Anaerolineae bacterium]|nr:sulfite exporter TauE/SafE family protein [Anaerolineae bacterium]